MGKRWKSGNRTSKLEQVFELQFLMPLGVKYKRQFKVSGKYYDFYLPEYNLLIEVDGDYWHGNKNTNASINGLQKKNQINDHKKDRIAKRGGYKLLRIWESDIKNNSLKVYKKLNREMRL